jgi:hypothetical protein
VSGSPAQQPRGLDRTDRLVAVALFVLLSSLYFATTSGITSSNDGSHYALTRAIVEQRTFSIDAYDPYAEGNDLAKRDGRLYSDRPPGTALAASLFYAIGQRLPAPPASLPSRHNPENPTLLYVMLLPAWAGAGTVVLLYGLLRMLGVSRFGALTACLALGVGTTHWKYSSVLFSHALSSFTVMLAVYLVIRAGRSPSTPWSLPFLLGFVLGHSVLVEYSNGVLVVAVALYLLSQVRPFAAKPVLAKAGLLALGGLLPAAFLAAYNTINFGGPFTLSYAYAINYPWAGDFGSTFNFPLGQGLRGMLIWGAGGGWCDPTCYNQGLLLLSPVLLLSLPGLVIYFRRARREFVLTTGLFLVYLGLFAKHRTFHGFTADGRYLVPFLGLWCVPLGYALDGLRTWIERGERGVGPAVAYPLLYGLLFLSVRNVFLHIGGSYNYALDLGQLDALVVRPQNWSYILNSVLRNTQNLPLLWLVEGFGLAGWSITHKLRSW